MSDRLAIAATASVLMMSIYVLFGVDAAPQGPFGGESLVPEISMPAPSVSIEAGDLLKR